jgi:hypothetical protein
VIEHSINLGHCIQLHNTSVLAKKLKYMDEIIRVVTEIELHPNNINREDGFSLTRRPGPLLHPDAVPVLQYGFEPFLLSGQNMCQHSSVHL